MNTEAQFIALVQKSEGIIYKISTFYSNNDQDRKDLHQEIVLQLWKSFPHYRGEAKATTWLYRVALNTAISLLKKEKRRVNQVPIEEAVIQLTDQSNDEYNDRIRLLYKHLDQLNEIDKCLLLLCLEEKSYEEMSEITGLTISNVGTRISRVKQKLKVRMSNAKYQVHGN